VRTIQLAFLLFTVRRKFLSSWALCNTYHFSHYRSNRFSPSFSSTTFQNFPGINRLLSEVYSKLQRHTKLCNQRDATYTMFFIIISAFRVSGGFFCPSSGAYKTVCAALGIVMLSCFLLLVWMGWFQPIHTSGRQQESMTIPTAAHTVL